MRVLFLSSEDLRDCKYFREGSKNLVKTRFGVADTIALCGKLDDAKRTKYGVMFTLNDGNTFTVTAGTFNEGVLKDSEKILEDFNNRKTIYLLVYANPFYKNGLYMNANQDNSVIVVDRENFIKFHELRKDAENYLKMKFDSGFKEKDISEDVGDVSSGVIEDIGVEVGAEVGAEASEEVIEDKGKEGKIVEGDEKAENKKFEAEFSDDELIDFVRKFSKEKPCEIEKIKNLLAVESNYDALKAAPFEKIENRIYFLIEAGVFYEPIPGYVKFVD